MIAYNDSSAYIRPVVRVEWTKDSGGRWKMEEVPDSEKFFPAQLVFLALGFLGPQAEVLKSLGVNQDGRSNVQTPPKVRYGCDWISPVVLMFCAEILDKCGRRLRRGRLPPWTILDRVGYQVSLDRSSANDTLTRFTVKEGVQQLR